jgi:hypothetical protein
VAGVAGGGLDAITGVPHLDRDDFNRVKAEVETLLTGVLGNSSGVGKELVIDDHGANNDANRGGLLNGGCG